MKSATVIGLGKLGAPLAACLAAKGLDVLGVDLDSQKVAALNCGHAPVFETGLEEMIARAGKRLKATSNIGEAVHASEATFIVVATPSESDGGFSLRYVLPVCEAVGAGLRDKRDFHLVVLVSTVMPGTTGGPVREILEQASGKKVGIGFGLCYGPEFIALGSVIHDFLHPDFVLIGESDARSGAMLEGVYNRVCENSPRAARMNFVNAEITKLSVNTFVTTKISFANMLARICEKLPDADVDVVTAALGLDTRIGAKYLKGAVSYGGPCFPRDNHALVALAHQVEAPADLARTTDCFNRSQVIWLADLVGRHAGETGRAGILGLTYKPNTDVVEEAVGILLARELVDRGVRTLAYDPAGRENSARSFGDQLQLAATAQECISQSDVVVLATPWPEFLSIPAGAWSRPGPPRIVVDCWRVAKHLVDEEGVRYLCLGMGEITSAALMAKAR